MTTPKKTKEEIMDGMNADALLAKEEFEGFLKELDDDTLAHITNWWEKWYLKAGHKRLAYILMNK